MFKRAPAPPKDMIKDGHIVRATLALAYLNHDRNQLIRRRWRAQLSTLEAIKRGDNLFVQDADVDLDRLLNKIESSFA